MTVKPVEIMITGANGYSRIKTKIIKDIVHQFIELPEDFISTIVDDPLVQRLRRIQQLSMASQVYPGAVHTRFEHSIGVAYTMRQAISSIRLNLRETVIPSYRSIEQEGLEAGSWPDPYMSEAVARFLQELEKELATLEKEAVTAALLHDIGHISLSHTAEKGLGDKFILYLPQGDATIPLSTHHEFVTLKIVNTLRSSGVKVLYNGKNVNMNIVYDILMKAYLKNSSSQCMEGVKFRRRRSNTLGEDASRYQFKQDDVRRVAVCLVARLLNSNIDVDRADYILRDSIHTGNISGIYDINRYYRVLTVVPKLMNSGANEFDAVFYLGVLDKGLSVVENMLLSRIYMYTDVYLHDISMIYSAMASRLISLLYVTGLSLLEAVAEGDDNAAMLLAKYPYLEALASFVLLTVKVGNNLQGVVSLATTKYSGADGLTRLLYGLTDDSFYTVIHSIYRGQAQDLLNYVASLQGRLGPLPCLALSLYSHALVSRKHATALINTSERAPRLIQLIKEGDATVEDYIKRNLNPLIVIDWSEQRPYKDDPMSRIYLFRRRKPLWPLELHQDERSKVTRKIMNETYSKIIIVFPGPPGAGIQDATWDLRPGKLHKILDSGLADAIGAPCGLSGDAVRKHVVETSKRAYTMARRIMETV